MPAKKKTTKPKTAKDGTVVPKPKFAKIAKPSPGRSAEGEYDVLNWPQPEEPRKQSRMKIGIHTSTSGGVDKAVERAYRLGCNTLQVFTSSPRMWRASTPSPQQCSDAKRLRALYDIGPMVVHVNYLTNVCSATAEFLAKSIDALRGEVERALAVSAEYLVLHPGSWKGLTREEGLVRAADSIAKAVDGLDLEGRFTLLIENTAGAEHSLGGSFEQVGELLARLRAVLPVAACIDTCHSHVSGYDLVTASGFADTMRMLESSVGIKNVPVWHCNDAKAPRGSKLDRHENIGQGTMGVHAFAQLLNDPRLEHAAFILETPIDEPGDDLRNIETLKALVCSE